MIALPKLAFVIRSPFFRTQLSKRSVTPLKMATTQASSEPKRKFKIALCQMPVTDSKQTNLDTARDYLQRAHQASADLAVLPECFQCPYSTSVFRDYAESLPSPSEAEPAKHDSPSLTMLQEMAKQTGMYIIGGSIPERDADNVYNTSLTVSPSGALLAKHRKAHLFDIDVPGKITFKESDVLSPGNDATVFTAPELSCSIGVAICYDIRFPELAMIQARQYGASLLVFPGAFNLTTGPAHWELLMRVRALDNQVYVAACSPARDTQGDGYKAWGHSMVVDPWAVVVNTADEKDALVVAEIDLDKIDTVRKSMPLLNQRRTDMYKLDYLN